MGSETARHISLHHADQAAKRVALRDASSCGHKLAPMLKYRNGCGSVFLQLWRA
jgi:hypothetical protein